MNSQTIWNTISEMLRKIGNLHIRPRVLYNEKNIKIHDWKWTTEVNIVELDTVHEHKYSSSSIFYNIFHIKPHFKKKKFFLVKVYNVKFELHIRCFVYNGPFVFLTKNVIDIVYRLWVSAKCVVLLGILVVWFYFNGPWPIIQYYQVFYLYNLSRFTFLKKKVWRYGKYKLPSSNQSILPYLYS